MLHLGIRHAHKKTLMRDGSCNGEPPRDLQGGPHIAEGC
jgi:hypothetical protein